MFRKYKYIIFITLLGLLLRVIGANQSLWLDEGASLMFAKMSLPQIFTAIKNDVHPPLFYIMLKYWLPFTFGYDWLLRVPSIIFGTLSIPALYSFCKHIYKKSNLVPEISALLLALNPLHIYYSQEIRMYAMATFLCLLSWNFLIRKNYILFTTLTILSLYTFYGTAFNLLAQVAYLFISKSWNKKYLFSLLAILVLSLFWIPWFLAQLDNGRFLNDMLPGWGMVSGGTNLKSLLLIPIKFIIGRISFSPQKLYFAIGISIVGLYSLIVFQSRKDNRSFISWLALTIPIVVATLVSIKLPMLGYWRFLYTLPFLLILTAAGLDQIHRHTSQTLFVILCFVSLLCNLYFWKHHEFQRENWRGFAELLHQKQALVVVDFPQSFAPLYYYAPDVQVLTAEDGNYQIKKDIIETISTSIKDRQPLFVMDYLADLSDKDRKLLKTIKMTENETGLRQVAIYNFNNLGQVYEFQKQ